MADIDKYHHFLNDEASSEDMEPEVLAFLEKASELRVPEGKRSMDDIWNAIDEATAEEEVTSGKTIRLWPVLSGLAAAVVLFFIGLQVYKVDPKEVAAPHEVATTIGEFQNITLPDGTQVTLNANSKLMYPEDWQRALTLEGEAFFEVTEGSKFTVTTSGGTVEVLGTSFNVFARDKDLIVSCKTGKVKVDVKEKAFTQVIKPGETISSDSDTVKLVQIEPVLIGKWQSGEFYFDSRPVMEVLEEIQRQYNVTIQADSLEDKLFSGYFSTASLDLALSMVCEPLNLSYDIIDGKDVVVTSN